jgi:phage shock protein A
MSFWNRKKEEPKPAPVDPSVQLQAAIDAQTESLKTSHTAVEQAAASARQLNREADTIASDVKALEHRLAAAPDDADLKVRLDQKRNQLDAKKIEIQAAVDQHQQGQNVLDEFHKAIEDTKRQADNLNIGLNLAEADKASAAFKLQLKAEGTGGVADAIAALKQKTAEAKAHAQVDRGLVTDPNEARDAEYLKAAQ